MEPTIHLLTHPLWRIIQKMLQLSASLVNRPVMSLRIGSPIAHTQSAIINPNDLKIEGFYCIDQFSKETLVLLGQNIRDIIREGLIVDDHDVLTDPSELIRLKPVMDIKFELVGKVVYTDKKQRLGKVSDYAADNQTLYIQKLYVERPILKSFSNGQLSIDRNQIIEITNRKVVVKDPLQPTKGLAPIPAQA